LGRTGQRNNAGKVGEKGRKKKTTFKKGKKREKRTTGKGTTGGLQG